MELYADFQCPACRSFVTGQLPALVSEFVRPGILRIEARDIEILDRGTGGESLELAAGAACAAEQERYWPFHDLVYWNQGRENRGDHDAAFIASVAAAAALDADTFGACLARSDVRQGVVATTSAAIAAGIQSTPTLVVNGQRIVGVPRADELRALIRSLAPGADPSAP
jgi:protein-disulfide isomerase